MRRVTCLSVLLATIAAVARAEDPVYFADVNLKVRVEKGLGKSDPTPTDMLKLTSLTAIQRHISSLTGLEYAKNLTETNLEGNTITDLSPLSGLQKLRALTIMSNGLSNLSPLSSMTSLEELFIDGNPVTNLSPLLSLPNLERLGLQATGISDISTLSGMTSLRRLNLCDNRIGNISALSSLTSLIGVDLCNNKVSDISALSGFGSLLWLDLNHNPLNKEAYCTGLPRLIANNPSATISYDPDKNPPANVSASDGAYVGKVHVEWDTSCLPLGRFYRVYRSDSEFGEKIQLRDWTSDTSLDDTSAEALVTYYYWVQAAASSSGSYATGFVSDSGWWGTRTATLTVSSTRGGFVRTPGEGDFKCTWGQPAAIAAVADVNYRFLGWSGSAVLFDKIGNAHAANTQVFMDKDYTLKASFVTTLDTLYVDDDAPADPCWYTPRVSDPREDGSSEHPFDEISEAIDVSTDGVRIVVRPGTYHETIDYAGRAIKVTGFEPNLPAMLSGTVIDANASGTVVTFDDGEDGRSVLEGFVITGGKGLQAGGIGCFGSSPTIRNCLIVGNRVSQAAGGAIYCHDSNCVITNCTIADNFCGEEGAGLLCSSPANSVVMNSSIVWGNWPRPISTTDGGVLSLSYTLTGTSGDNDPLFAERGFWVNVNAPNDPVRPNDPGATWVAGDYHLKSRAGRWDPISQTWISDDVTSPCIDTGDPQRSAAFEPLPNGGKLNMGAYGGTSEASKSYLGAK
jgi:parallel beta-helix repeat protein